MNKKKKLILIIFVLISIITVLLISYFSFDKLNANVLMFENDKISVKYYDLKLENDYIDLYYYDSKRIDVTVNFDDVISENKKIVISLKEGLSFVSLPMLKVEDTYYQTEILPTDSLYNAIKNIDTSNLIVEDNSGKTNNIDYKTLKSIYNEVTYNINSNIKSVTLSFNISSDVYRYYGEKNIEDALKVEAYKDGNKIGDISNDFHLYDSINGTSKFIVSYYTYKSNGITDYIKASTDEETFFGKSYNMYLNISRNGKSGVTTLPYYKYIIITSYLPEDTIFDILKSTNDAYNIDIIRHPDNTPYLDSNGKVKKEYINDSINLFYFPEEDNKAVLVTANQRFENSSFNYYYKTKKYTEITGLEKSGDYVKRQMINYSSSCSTGKNCNNTKVVYYDGAERTYYTNYSNVIQIWYPFDIPNVMRPTADSLGEKYKGIEDSDNNTFIYGPFINIENPSPGEKINQTIEYEIPEDYQAIGVTFPRGTNATIRDIKYKIYGTCNNCGTADNEGWYSFSKNLDNGVFNKVNIGDVSESYYLKAVKGVVSSYQEGFNSGASSNRGASNAVIYGNLKNNIDEVIINFYIYSEEENREDKKYQQKIIRTPDTAEFNTVSARQHYSSDLFGQEVVKTGESFSLNRKIAIYNYSYGNRHYIKNVQIYIREPKGVSLNLNSLKLIYNKYNFDTNKLDVCDLINGRNNSCGNYIDINNIKAIKREKDNIYIINTNVDIGYYLTELETLYSKERLIVANLSYKVDDDSLLTELETDQLISFGNNEKSIFVNQRIYDIYDMDNDGLITDYVPSIINDNIIIQKSSSFVVSSSIKKDGVEYGAYNESNPNTIINMNLKESFEYNLEVINNTDKNAKFEIYIPIQKKGVSYNDKLKIDNFDFDLNLLDKINVNDIFDVKYTTEKELINLEKINFADYDSLDKNDITMIKLSSINTIPTGSKYNIIINLKVSDKIPDKGKKLNIWNTISYITTSNLEGEFYGTKTALKLNYKEISGFVYWDKNANDKFDEEDSKGSLEEDLIYIELLDENDLLLARTGLTKLGTFSFDENLIKDINRYKLKIIYPNKNYNSEINENYIYELTEDNNIHRFEIPYLNYKLDFKIIDEINIFVDEEMSLEISNILPIYFNKIKHDIPYEWMLNVNDDGFIEVNIKENNVLVKGKKVKENILLDIIIKDKFNNSVSKTIKVNVLERKPPVIYAEDVYINVGDEVKFEEYIKKVEDGKGNKVILIYDGDNKNTEYKFNIPIENNKAIKSGTYNVEYIVVDKYGLTSEKIIKVYVKADDVKGTIIPSTLDNIYFYVLLFVISSVIIILSIMYLKKIKKDYK